MLVELRAGLYGMNVDWLSSSVLSLIGPGILAQRGCEIGSVDYWLEGAPDPLLVTVRWFQYVTPTVEGSECLIRI